MNVMIALGLILLAGIINGSFALPIKYVSKWRAENIWLNYAIWAFIILPWLTMFFLAPQIFQIYKAVPFHDVLIMIIGGFLFGAGQVGFAFAMGMIGIGLTFVICLGLGTGLGFLLPLVFQHPDQIATPFGIVTLFGTLLAIMGLIISTYAGQLRDQEKKKILEMQAQPQAQTQKYVYIFGVLLAAIAGIFSAGQNFSFSLTADMQQIANTYHAAPLAAANIMWPGFLIFSFIPYAAYMLYLHFRNHTFSCYWQRISIKYYFFSIIMGLFWFGSLMFYSQASRLIGRLGPVVGWPLFMVLIILTSNFLGWRHHEWDGCGQKTKRVLWVGLCLLILSVIVLGYGSYFHAG